MSKYVIDSTTLTAIGDAVRSKTKSTDLIKVSDLPATISNITTGGGGEETNTMVFPPCQYLMSNSNSSKNYYKAILNGTLKIKNPLYLTSSSITLGMTSMFSGLSKITDLSSVNITVEDNDFSSDLDGFSCNSAFVNCSTLQKLPKIQSDRSLSSATMMFQGCYILREDEIQKFLSSLTPWTEEMIPTTNFSQMFNSCYCMREVPKVALNLFKYNYIYKQMFMYNYALNKIENFPVYNKTVVTSQMFAYTFYSCGNARKFTFEPNQTATWSKQTIDLSYYFGTCEATGYVVETSYKPYNGILGTVHKDEDVSLLDSDDYVAAGNKNFSKYGPIEAYETICSLPDVTAGSSNTIIFLGTQYRYDDATATINTLTEEQIAVATAKGWTVSFAT